MAEEITHDDPELNTPESLKKDIIYNQIIRDMSRKQGGPSRDYVAQNTNAIDQINIDITSIQTDIVSLQSSVDAINQSIATIQTDIQNLFIIVHTIESQISTGFTKLEILINNLQVQVDTS